MKRKLLSMLILASFYPPVCVANSERWTNCISDGNFYDLKDLAEELALFARVSKAVVKTPYSSGVRISKNGHILMSSHQLENCFLKKGLYKDGLIKNPPKEISCSITVNGRRTDAKVLAARNCDEDAERKIKERRQNAPSVSLSPGESRCLAGADLAIVQVQEKSTKAGCLPINFDKQPLGAKMMLAGYPEETTRPGVRNSDGRGQFATFGKTIDQAQCAYNVVNKTVSLEYQKWLFSREYQLDLASYKGSSGGPYVNENGEIVAIHSASISPTPGATCKGSTFATPTYLLKESAEAWGADIRWAELECL